MSNKLYFSSFEDQINNFYVQILDKKFYLPENILINKYEIINPNNINLDINFVNNINQSIYEYNLLLYKYETENNID